MLVVIENKNHSTGRKYCCVKVNDAKLTVQLLFVSLLNSINWYGYSIKFNSICGFQHFDSKLATNVTKINSAVTSSN